MKYLIHGVIVNNETRGSSIIGDGLAGTIFSFPDLEDDTERTRIIVFATDYSDAGLEGAETISFEDACSLCKKYNINIFAYCPTTTMNFYVTKEGLENYKNAIETRAGGKFYTGNLKESVSSIVDEIKTTKTSLLENVKKTYVVDYPQIPLIIAIITIIILNILEKRIRL